MSVSQWYLGRPGFLLPVNCPAVGLDRSPLRPGGIRTLLSGGYSVDLAPRARRQWKMTWPKQANTDYNYLYELYTGQRGGGPYAFLDPKVVNMLYPNQASAGSAHGNTDGYNAIGGTLTTQAAFTQRGVGANALQWVFTGADTSQGTVELVYPTDDPISTDDWWSWPVLTGQPVSFQFYSLASSTGPQFRPQIIWLDAVGNILSTVTGTYTTAGTGTSWTAMTLANQTPPAGAVFFRALIQVNPASITGAFTTWHDIPCLEYNTSCSAWQPGQGAPYVSIAQFGEVQWRYSLTPLQDVTATLVEIS
jgi:hypothetical protein